MNRKYVLLLLLIVAVSRGLINGKTIHAGKWNVDVDVTNGAVTATFGGDTILNRSIASWGLNDRITSFSECNEISVKSAKIDNQVLGKSTIVKVVGIKVAEAKAELRLVLAPKTPHMLVDLTVSGPASAKGLNFMEPVDNRSAITLDGRENLQLFVPYDNDAWVRYSVKKFGQESNESYEIGGLFDAVSRRGLVVGSVDHDNWKSAIKYKTEGVNRVVGLQLYSGVTSSFTRDVRSHGVIKGTSVSSARFYVALTSDWRDGVEAIADATAKLWPNETKPGPRPFGWNSGGDLQTKINFDNANEVVEFFAENLARSFHGADSTVVIDLDAFWDFGFKPEQHREFVKQCKSHGFKAGIYYCPFTDWGNNQEVVVAEAPGYKMGDLYLRHDGVPIEFDGAPALDPTHPGTKARIERQLKEFIDWGYEYVKIDFMAHGAYESDHHYDPDVTTGTQAFNRGMSFIDSIAGDKLWINLSIAPLFPARYAQSRRIGCDAWNNIGSTEYTLNALTYGWWLDHMYYFNDADHIVFKEVSEGENRARLTSSAITGVYFLGDNFSSSGEESVKERARMMACNDEINDMARKTKSFRPVRPGRDEKASNIFEGTAPGYRWVALFNYDEPECEISFSLNEIGLDGTQIDSAVELWTGEPVTIDREGKIGITLPGKDARVVKFKLK